jgi:hypothetical protein
VITISIINSKVIPTINDTTYKKMYCNDKYLYCVRQQGMKIYCRDFKTAEGDADCHFDKRDRLVMNFGSKEGDYPHDSTDTMFQYKIGKVDTVTAKRCAVSSPFDIVL